MSEALTLFYQDDATIKADLLMQYGHEFDVLAEALRSDAYAIVSVQAARPGTPNAIGRLTGLVNGQALIRYGTGRDAGWDVIHLEYSDGFTRVPTAHGSWVRLPAGELTARWHASGAGIVHLRVPPKIALILTELQTRGQTQYEYTTEIALWNDAGRRDIDMAAEAEADPEGAFGGRGNNFRWS